MKIFLTGGTGSFGQCFVKKALANSAVESITVYSRDEMKQWELAQRLSSPKLRWIIGDVRDKDRLSDSVRGHDTVVHAAATKIVPTAEINPEECIKTNVIGAMNLVSACLANNVFKCVALSTDKASNPVNLYGASKLASDKIFVAANAVHENFVSSSATKFVVVRYGNVLASRGSVIPFFVNLAKAGSSIPITDPRMTRFVITLDEAVEFVFLALEKSCGGEIFVPKLPSVKILDLVEAIAPKLQRQIIGVRPGEKLHEQMISSDESLWTAEYDAYYKILPSSFPKLAELAATDGQKVPEAFSYTSDINDVWMDSDSVRVWIHQNLGVELPIQ